VPYLGGNAAKPQCGYGGVYGVGGGAIIAPFFVTYLGFRSTPWLGNALWDVYYLVLGWAPTRHFPCYIRKQTWPQIWPGAVTGPWRGAWDVLWARLQKYMPARAIKALLCMVILGTAVKYLFFNSFSM